MFTAAGWLKMTEAEKDALVEPLYADYLARLDVLTKNGMYPYNDLFRGYLADANPMTTLTTPKDQDTAIYLCQTRCHREEDAAKLAAFVACGAVKITPEDFKPGEVRRGTVAVVGRYMNETGYEEYRDVRVQLQGGRPARLIGLPKGKRTSGYNLSCGTATYFLSN